MCCDRDWAGNFRGALGTIAVVVGRVAERELAPVLALPTVPASPRPAARLFTMKRLLPPFLFAVCAALMLALKRWAGSGPWPADTGVAGAAAMSAGLCLLVVARLQFARAHTNIYTFDEPGQLVTSGVFRISRHPMYLGFALALLGWALMLRSWPALCVAAAFVLITDRWYIAFEERWLRDKFGRAYQAYAARTRRWV